MQFYQISTKAHNKEHFTTRIQLICHAILEGLAKNTREKKQEKK